MGKLLLIMLCFKIVNLQLLVPKEKDDLKQCIHSLIGNLSDGYHTVLFYSDNSYDYGFYNSTKISYINIDARRNIYNLQNYRYGKDVIVITLSNTQQFIEFIIILSFEEECDVRKVIFPYLWDARIVKAVCLYYDENTIKLYTSDPEHPANHCGTTARFRTWLECNFIEKIKFPKLWRNYTDCELIYWYRHRAMALRLKLLTVTQYEHSITFLEELSESQLPIVTSGKMAILFKHEEDGDTIYNKIKNKTVLNEEFYIVKALQNEEIKSKSSILITDLDLDLFVEKFGVKLHYFKDEKYLQNLSITSLVSRSESYLFTPIN
ncbi:hypothetical protein FQA39_LY12467 [Lamprigera yunnana]|nr:hypothetical protein FQA39_LY12467 [Lamprigera yunnana]